MLSNLFKTYIQTTPIDKANQNQKEISHNAPHPNPPSTRPMSADTTRLLSKSKSEGYSALLTELNLLISNRSSGVISTSSDDSTSDASDTGENVLQGDESLPIAISTSALWAGACDVSGLSAQDHIRAFMQKKEAARLSLQKKKQKARERKTEELTGAVIRVDRSIVQKAISVIAELAADANILRAAVVERDDLYNRQMKISRDLEGQVSHLKDSLRESTYELNDTRNRLRSSTQTSDKKYQELLKEVHEMESLHLAVQANERKNQDLMNELIDLKSHLDEESKEKKKLVEEFEKLRLSSEKARSEGESEKKNLIEQLEKSHNSIQELEKKRVLETAQTAEKDLECRPIQSRISQRETTCELIDSRDRLRSCITQVSEERSQQEMEEFRAPQEHELVSKPRLETGAVAAVNNRLEAMALATQDAAQVEQAMMMNSYYHQQHQQNLQPENQQQQQQQQQQLVYYQLEDGSIVAVAAADAAAFEYQHQLQQQQFQQQQQQYQQQQMMAAVADGGSYYYYCEESEARNRMAAV